MGQQASNPLPWMAHSSPPLAMRRNERFHAFRVFEAILKKMIDFLADPIETGQLHAMLDQHGVKSPYNTMFFFQESCLYWQDHVCA